MRHIREDIKLQELYNLVIEYAASMKRTLPEMRFFILDPMEFASLLMKNVYPTSPVNIWEGRDMVEKKNRIQTGQESALYYEVVQTGNPSYAYLNSTNNAMTQASVMAHVVGHCEFSELNVLHDSNMDRTEYVMHLVNKVNLARKQLGESHYRDTWNALMSITSMVHPQSQYNLENSLRTEKNLSKEVAIKKDKQKQEASLPYSETLQNLFKYQSLQEAFIKDQAKKESRQTLSRKGYKLKAPCQDIFGFLSQFAPASEAERDLMRYLYTIKYPQEFIMKTQIMNEGWAMYWEKKIMTELFKKKAVDGIIDYSRVFSNVCNPRPFFMRNPYHLGYHMWCHIEELYSQGKVSLEYFEETSREKKEQWEKKTAADPVHFLDHLVETITDYEFLRRFLTPDLVEKLWLNRIHKRMGVDLPDDKIIREDHFHFYLEPNFVKEEMLNFFSHFYSPRIYLIDTDFKEGGLLLFHRNDGRKLKKEWIRPTLKNINVIWKGSVHLLSMGDLYSYSAGQYNESTMQEISFEQVVDRMRDDKNPVS